MKLTSKIVFLSDPRTGSTNIFRIMERHPDLDLLGEPFNENFVRWAPGNEDFRSQVRDISSLDATVDRIFTQHGGFKLQGYQLYGDEVGGLPCDLDSDLVGHLLQRDDVRFIFLKRLNVLQSVVSNLISNQTGIWQKWDLKGPIDELYAQLNPLDVEDVRRRVQWVVSHVKRCESVLGLRGKEDWHAVVYEDFYYSTQGRQAAQLRAMWDFLEVDPVDPAEVEYYLTPAATKLNSPDTYRHVPNADEINSVCGSDEHGWLFDLLGGAS